MRFTEAPSSLLSLLAVFLSAYPVAAGPYPKDDLHDAGYGILQDRSCYAYCGASNQYCCSVASEAACYTDANQVAYCTAGTGAEVTGTNYQVFTTTYVDVTTITSTGTSYFAAATTAGSSIPICDTADGQTSCGSICCANGQRCIESGYCGPEASSWIFTAGTTSDTAPFRGTTVATATSTLFVSATTTEPFATPVAASGSTLPLAENSTTSSGLSGGAIAGIVIGTIAGVILLLLLCFCCIVKAGFDGLLALFGLGSGRKRRTERTEITETQRYSRHSGTAAGGSRYAAGSARPSRVTETRKQKTGGTGGLAAVGTGLLGLAVAMGLKRKREEKKEVTEVRREARRDERRPAMTEVSSDYYTDDYTTESKFP